MFADLTLDIHLWANADTINLSTAHPIFSLEKLGCTVRVVGFGRRFSDAGALFRDDPRVADVINTYAKNVRFDCSLHVSIDQSNIRFSNTTFALSSTTQGVFEAKQFDIEILSNSNTKPLISHTSMGAAQVVVDYGAKIRPITLNERPVPGATLGSVRLALQPTRASTKLYDKAAQGSFQKAKYMYVAETSYASGSDPIEHTQPEYHFQNVMFFTKRDSVVSFNREYNEKLFAQSLNSTPDELYKYLRTSLSDSVPTETEFTVLLRFVNMYDKYTEKKHPRLRGAIARIANYLVSAGLKPKNWQGKVVT